MRTAVVSFALICASMTACQRQNEQLRPEPTRLVVFADAARESELEPGGKQPHPQPSNPFGANAYDISEGQRLFSWYNCSGCHANGGGAIGPPLIKQDWIYGGEPANLFDTIVKGRPNGMPTWGGRIPEYQIWQIIAYIRSLNNEQPRSITPARPDSIEQNSKTIRPRSGI
jgi:cytochrome c oxidase cbb3-type subunit 3